MKHLRILVLCLGAFVVLFGAALGQTTQASIAGVPVVTVCEALHDPGRYNGKSIVVLGKLVSTDEGSWLSDECQPKIQTNGFMWASVISTAYARSEVQPPPGLPKGFKWDKTLLTKKLESSGLANHGDKLIAIFGRFETRLPLQVAEGADGKLRGDGFGHLNAAPAQLVFPEKKASIDLK